MAALLRRARCCTATSMAPSYIIGLGDYTGGSLWIYDPTHCLSFLQVRSSSAPSRRAVLAAGTLAPPVTCCQSWLARGWQLPTSGAQPQPQRTVADYVVAPSHPQHWQNRARLLARRLPRLREVDCAQAENRHTHHHLSRASGEPNCFLCGGFATCIAQVYITSIPCNRENP